METRDANAGDIATVSRMLNITRRKISAVPDALPQDIPQILKRIYRGRNVCAADELERGLKYLLPYQGLLHIDKAVRLLASALQQQQKLLIIGDYDADGATSCAVALKALRAMGAQQVQYLVPNRFEYGYGLTPEIVAVAVAYQPDLIITVDNGIASLAGVAAAKQRGIKVLITDHHLPGEQLPNADAIVNPNQPGDTFKSKNLAGVGVIFYIMMALRAYLREQGWFTQQGLGEPNLAEYLDLVALGTVADVVRLDHNNRILVAQGLARIRASQCCAGIRALLQVAGREPAQMSASDLGFRLGPRINAAGRLEDISIGIECLLAGDETRALEIATVLDGLNHERRHIEGEMRQQALAIVESMSAKSLPLGICLYDPGWHEGVIGILAGRLKDKFHRPAIVFASSNNNMLKGSARSIKDLHIRDALDEVATRHPQLLSKFGGHAMAAGLTIRQQDLAQFKQAFNEVLAEHLNEDDLRLQIISDGELAAEEMNLEIAEQIRQGGPWGHGFAEPLFDGIFELVEKRIVGEKHLKMLVRQPQSRELYDAIAFFTDDRHWRDRRVEKLQLVYRLDVNEFQGKRSVQLLVEQLQPL